MSTLCFLCEIDDNSCWGNGNSLQILNVISKHNQVGICSVKINLNHVCFFFLKNKKSAMFENVLKVFPEFTKLQTTVSWWEKSIYCMTKWFSFFLILKGLAKPARRTWGAIMHTVFEKCCIKSFVVPEITVWSLINVGLKTINLKMKKIWRCGFGLTTPL